GGGDSYTSAMRTPTVIGSLTSLHIIGSLGVLPAPAGAQATSAMSVPSLFAPNVVSTRDSGEAFGTLTPDGREFYFTKHHDFARHHIMVSRLAQGQWSQPELCRSPASTTIASHVSV